MARKKTEVTSSSNTIRTDLAGTDLTEKLGTAFSAIIKRDFGQYVAPSPIVTPDIIVTLSPIHTSLPIITSPFVDGWPFPLKLLNVCWFIWPNGYVVTQFVLWLPPKYTFTPPAIEQKFPTTSLALLFFHKILIMPYVYFP